MLFRIEYIFELMKLIKNITSLFSKLYLVEMSITISLHIGISKLKLGKCPTNSFSNEINILYLTSFSFFFLIVSTFLLLFLAMTLACISFKNLTAPLTLSIGLNFSFSFSFSFSFNLFSSFNSLSVKFFIVEFILNSNKFSQKFFSLNILHFSAKTEHIYFLLFFSSSKKTFSDMYIIAKFISKDLLE